MRSPSIGQARSATISGAVMLMAPALAIGMKTTAKKKQRLERKSVAERAICNHGRRVRNRPMPCRGRNAASMNTTWPKARAQDTCKVE